MPETLSQPQSPSSGQGTGVPDLRQYVGIILRGSWVIAIVFGVVFVGAVIYVSSLPSIYEATSRTQVYAPAGERYVGALGEGSGPVGGTGVSLETEARNVRTGLRAQVTAKRIQEENPDLRPRITPSEVLSSLIAETVEPDQIVIRARSEDPKRAMLIANATAETCVEESTKLAAAELTNRTKFIEGLLTKVQDDLRQAEQAVLDFMREEGFIQVGGSGRGESPAVDSLEGGVTELAAQRAERRTASAELEATRTFIASLRERLATMEKTEQISTLVEDPLLSELRTRLAGLEVELIRAKARYTENNAKVLDLQDEIAEIRRRLLEHTPKPIEVPTTQPNMLYESLRKSLLEAELRVVELEARKEALDGEIQSAQAAIKELPEKRQKLAALQRVSNGLEERYAALLEKLQDARIDEAVQEGNVKIADLALVPPTKPVLPQRRKTLLFAILLGLAGGAALAFFLDYLDTAVQTPEDIERHVGISCLGFVPMTMDEAPGSIITVRKPKAPSSEAYRSVRSAIKFASLDSPLRSMCITSAGASEGKSQTSANLAAVIAESGQRVVVIDTDLRRPSLHRLLEADNEFGLTNVLAGDMPLERALQPTLVDGLLLLASGPLPPNPSELLDSQRMTDLVQELSTQCDLILCDTPPLLVVTDANVMAAKCDATVLVAETGRVSREALQKCAELVRAARGHVVGAILNKVRLTKATSYYYYYYYREYYYYGYYGDSARRRRRRRPRSISSSG